MTNAVSVSELEAQQAALQAKFNDAQTALQDAQSKFQTTKAALVEFNNKYGRVLQMMRED